MSFALLFSLFLLLKLLSQDRLQTQYAVNWLSTYEYVAGGCHPEINQSARATSAHSQRMLFFYFAFLPPVFICALN